MEFKTIFFCIWGVTIIGLLAFLYIRGKKALSIFPSIKGETILFREKWVSGYSDQSFILKTGAANNILDVIVTSTELWIKMPILLAGFNEFNLLHKINLEHIHQVELEGKYVIVKYKKGTTDCNLALQMKKSKDFIQIMNKQCRLNNV